MMASKNNSVSFKEIWNIMPPRFQGMVFMLILSLQIEMYQGVQSLLSLNALSYFGASILLLVYFFWVFRYCYAWLFERNFKDEK